VFPKSSRLQLMGVHSLANLISQSQILLERSSDSAKLDAEVLLCFLLNKERSYLLTWPEKLLTDEQLLCFIGLLERRIKGEPIAYITGVKEFWSLPFAVSTATLIPRPDTETLVEVVLAQYDGEKNIRCLDLGTGTGAIALALASENSTWQIDAVDFNADAVRLAQRNAQNLNLEKVNVFLSDWFAQVEPHKKYNVIVSNPPYIDSEDENLNQGDVRFEPKSALVANEQGLADIKHIAELARTFLSTQGKLFFEHGFEQGQAVRYILAALGYEYMQTEKDLNGHDRVTWAVFPK